MKTQTKTIAVVLALFLVAACFVGSAAADRTLATGNGANVFVYEKIVIQDATTGTQLIKYSGDNNPVALNTIPGTGTTGTVTFDLLEASVGTYIGTYYYNGANPTAGTTLVNIWYPELTLKAYLDGTTDSVEGKSFEKLTDIEFIIESPRVGPANIMDAKIVFTTPVGGKTTQLGNTPFAAVTLDAPQVTAGTANAGVDAASGTYVAQAEFVGRGGAADAAFIAIPDKYKKSTAVSFTVQSSTLTLTANKDSVVRSNPFTTLIQGESNQPYFIFIESTGDPLPWLQPGQSGMHLANPLNTLDVTRGGVVTAVTLTNDPTGDAQGVNGVAAGTNANYAYFVTDAAGKRTVQWNTDANTEDKTYTIKVVGLTYTAAAPVFVEDTNRNDKVKVKVEKGAVTITASGDRSYYIGEEIKLTGTNTDSSNVWLFITGPNLINDGEILTNLPRHVAAAGAAPVAAPWDGRAADESVKTDNTWEYKWDTSDCGLDTGAYTIYATSRLTNGKSSAALSVDTDADGTPDLVYAAKLSDSEYATVSVNLKQPFLSAVPSGTTVAKGDKIYIRGTAEGDPTTLQLYVFGPNKYVRESISVEDDGSYEKKLEISSDWSSNQYFVVIEHPMYNGQIDVFQRFVGANGVPYASMDLLRAAGTTYRNTILQINNAVGNTQQASFIVEGTDKLQGSNAADALTKMIDSANIDDIYTKLTFTVAEPWIKINNPGDQTVGSTFTISGTTNLAVDDQILIEVVSSSFNAIDKTSTSTTSGFSQTTKVVAGDGNDNAWSIEVDSTNFKLDEYTIKAAGIETDVTTTVNFNLVEAGATPAPTTTAAPTGTSAPSTTAPTATPTAAPTPGFGAFLALAGLGAVALLVLRRN